MQGIFPQEFNKAAMSCYKESEDAFKSMFEDATKYKVIMESLGELFFSMANSKRNVEYKIPNDYGLLNVAQTKSI